MDNFISLQNKLVDVGLKTDSFRPEGEKNDIEYTRLVLKCVINGNIEEVVFKPEGKTQVLVLKSLQDIDDDVLDLYQNNKE